MEIIIVVFLTIVVGICVYKLPSKPKIYPSSEQQVTNRNRIASIIIDGREQGWSNIRTAEIILRALDIHETPKPGSFLWNLENGKVHD